MKPSEDDDDDDDNNDDDEDGVSFAFTHTYAPVKTNIFPFFPKRTWKILKNVQKQKNNKTICCPMLPVVVSFFPLFFWEPFPYGSKPLL